MSAKRKAQRKRKRRPIRLSDARQKALDESAQRWLVAQQVAAQAKAKLDEASAALNACCIGIVGSKEYTIDLNGERVRLFRGE